MSSYLQEEEALSRVCRVGPIGQVVEMGIHCSPFGVIPKKGRVGKCMPIWVPCPFLGEGLALPLFALPLLGGASCPTIPWPQNDDPTLFTH